MKILHLTIKKKFFDMIFHPDPDQRKKEEYRDIKSYWVKRFFKDIEDLNELVVEFKKYKYNSEQIKDWLGESVIKYDAIQFRNGYNPDSPTGLIEWKGLDVGDAVPEWSDNWEGNVFRTHLGEIIEMRNASKNATLSIRTKRNKEQKLLT